MPSEEDAAKSVSSDDNVFVYFGESSSELDWITHEDLNDIVRWSSGTWSS